MRQRIYRVMGVVLLFAVIAATQITGIQKEKSRHAVEDEIARFKQQENADGIVEETPDPYFIKEQKGYKYGSSQTITYYSEITQTMRHAMVFQPADYDEKKSYPVLYLLHGYGGSHKTWRNKKADVILQNLSYFEDVPEMIVVCPNSNINKDESVDDTDFWACIEPFDHTTEEVVQYLMPYINAHYPVKQGRENTAVAGNSMGGRNALALAYTYPELFGYVGAFSSATAVEEANDTSMVSAPLHDLDLPVNKENPFDVLMLAVGRSDDVCGEVTYELNDYMNQQNIEHIFYDTEGGHQTVVWQNALYNFARKIFK